MGRFFSILITTFFLLSEIQNLSGQAFWSEDFSGGLPFSWTTLDQSNNNIVFEHCNASEVCLESDYHFNSSTHQNGYVYCQSAKPLFYTEPHETTLVSEEINCLGKQEVFLAFQSYITTFNKRANDNAWVTVSNGLQEESYYPYPLLDKAPESLQSSRSPHKSIIDISEIAAGQERIRITWNWRGLNENYFCLDDIELFEKHPLYKDAVWGDQPGEGDFANGLNDWQTYSPQSMPKYWEWKDRGNVIDALSIKDDASFPYIESYTNHNGAAVFNADYHTTNGVNQVGAPYPIYISELISPTINLADVAEDLFIQFSQYTMLLGECSFCDNGRTDVAYSIDAGRTWSDPIPINETLSPNKERNSIIRIPISGVAGKSRFKMKFIFSGDLYFWVIDDVLLIKRNQFDLKVMENYFAIAPNALTPKSQASPISFMGDVKNIGLETVYEVNYTAQVTNNENEILHTDTLFFDSIRKDDFFEENIFNKYFIPEAIEAIYNVKYKVHGEHLESELSDNELNFQFEISDTTFAKETGANAKVVPSGLSASFTYGNCFYVPRGHGWQADRITFGIANTEQLEGREIIVSLIGFHGDHNGDEYANTDEYEVLSSNAYKFTGSEGIESNGLISIPVSYIENDSLTRLDRFPYYFATINYNTFDNKLCQVYTSFEHNYQAMYFRAKAVGLPRYAGIIKENNSDNYDLIGFNLTQVPLIRLHIKRDPRYTYISEKMTPDLNFKIFPNPAISHLFIDLNKPVFGTNSKVEIVDAMGSIISSEILDFGANSLKVPTGHLARGIYFLRLLTDSGVLSRKFFKN